MRDSNYTPRPLCLSIEVAVPREKRGIALPFQQNDNLLIHQTLSADVKTNLFGRQTPRLKQQALPFKDALVENNQACARSSPYSGPAYCSE
jgi:hypothetical protein